MKIVIRKIVSLALVVTFVALGVGFYAPKKAEADALDTVSSAACEASRYVKGLVDRGKGEVLGFFEEHALGKVRKTAGDAIGELRDTEKGQAAEGAAKDAIDKLGGEALDKAEEGIKKLKEGAKRLIPIGASEVPIRVNEDQLKALIEIQETTIASTTKAREETEEKIACEKRVRGIISTALKRRLIDAMVGSFTAWLQDDGTGDPRFITDTEGFLRDAGEAVVGELAQEVGLGALCYPIQQQRLILDLDLGRRSFKHRVSCTLGDIKENLGDFYEDFTFAGGREGWKNYRDLLKPENNKWGLQIIVREELDRRTTESREAARQEAVAGQGFLSVKTCTRWQRVPHLKLGVGPYGLGNEIEVVGETKEDPKTKKTYEILEPTMINWKEEYYNPRTPPGKPGDGWICPKEYLKTVTPGRAVAGVTEKIINSNVDFIVNNQDLAEYAAAIVDAALSRGIKMVLDSKAGEEVRNVVLGNALVTKVFGLGNDTQSGLAGAFRGETDKTRFSSKLPLSSPRSQTENERAIEEALEAGSTIEQVFEEGLEEKKQGPEVVAKRDGLEDRIVKALDSLGIAESELGAAQVANDELIEVLGNIDKCQEEKILFNIDPEANQKLAAALERASDDPEVDISIPQYLSRVLGAREELDGMSQILEGLDPAELGYADAVDGLAGQYNALVQEDDPELLKSDAVVINFTTEDEKKDADKTWADNLEVCGDIIE